MASIHLGSGNGFPGLLSALNIDSSKNWNNRDIFNLRSLYLTGKLTVNKQATIDTLVATYFDGLFMNHSGDMIPPSTCLKITGYDLESKQILCSPIESLKDHFFGMSYEKVGDGDKGIIELDGPYKIKIDLSAGTVNDTVYSDEKGCLNLDCGIPVGFLMVPDAYTSIVYISRIYQYDITSIRKIEVNTASKEDFSHHEVWDTEIGFYLGFVHVTISADQINALFLITRNYLTVISDPSRSFGFTPGASDYNVYYIGSTLHVENNYADMKNCYVALYGGMPG